LKAASIRAAPRGFGPDDHSLWRNARPLTSHSTGESARGASGGGRQTISTQNALAAYFESQAAWRAAKAKDYPDDYRNKNSETALLELAGLVRSLPDEDPRIVAAAALDSDDFLEVAGLESGLEVAGYPAARIGFSNEKVDLDGEFTLYVRRNLEELIGRFDPSVYGSAMEGRAEEKRLQRVQIAFLAALAGDG